MKLICGTTVAEEKARQGKEGKVTIKENETPSHDLHIINWDCHLSGNWGSSINFNLRLIFLPSPPPYHALVTSTTDTNLDIMDLVGMDHHRHGGFSLLGWVKSWFLHDLSHPYFADASVDSNITFLLPLYLFNILHATRHDSQWPNNGMHKLIMSSKIDSYMYYWLCRWLWQGREGGQGVRSCSPQVLGPYHHH